MDSSALFRIIFFFILASSAQSLKLNSIPQEETEVNRAKLSSCISDYSMRLNTIVSGLGDHILERSRNFSFDKIPEHNRGNTRVFGVGMGTTATRSLSTAMRMMGMQGSHFGPQEAGLAMSIGLVFTQQAKKMKKDKPSCYKHLEAMFPQKYNLPKGNYAMDTPIPELFLDEYFSFPGAKFILTLRNSTKWVKARYHHSGHELAPLQEPCGHYMPMYTHEQNAAMMDYHSELVRCVVPKDRLFEINVFEDPPEKMKRLAVDLSRFVGRREIHQFPGGHPQKRKLRLSKMEEAEKQCDSHKDVMKLYRKTEMSQRSTALKNISAGTDGSQTFSVQVSMEGEGEELALTSERLGMLIHYAAQMDCEVTLVGDADK